MVWARAWRLTPSEVLPRWYKLCEALLNADSRSASVGDDEAVGEGGCSWAGLAAGREEVGARSVEAEACAGAEPGRRSCPTAASAGRSECSNGDDGCGGSSCDVRPAGWLPLLEVRECLDDRRLVRVMNESELLCVRLAD